MRLNLSSSTNRATEKPMDSRQTLSFSRRLHRRRLGTMKYVAIVVLVVTVGCSSPTAPTPPQPPTINGQWTGPYNLTSCTTTGAANGSAFCPNLGSGGVMVLTPQQTGSNVAGTLAIGAFNVPVTGSVSTDRVVTLSGTAVLSPVAVLTLQTWRATVTGSTMTGTVQYTIAVTDAPVGAATVAATFSLQK